MGKMSLIKVGHLINCFAACSVVDLDDRISDFVHEQMPDMEKEIFTHVWEEMKKLGIENVTETQVRDMIHLELEQFVEEKGIDI